MSNNTNITGAVTDKLVEAFEFFNAELDTQLDNPVFTLIPNRGRQSYYGWYWQGRWKDGKNTLPEINITADTLKRSVEDICETIIHEMVHYANNLEGVHGLHPMWGKAKLMSEFDRAIDKLNTITYPYKV